jgi:AcrR family transcriptional regulator
MEPGEHAPADDEPRPAAGPAASGPAATGPAASGPAATGPAASGPAETGVGDPQRPMRADARRNYERLVAVAREAFTHFGIGAPLDDIARHAEVGPGTLYRHFPTRDSLLAAVYRGDIEQLARQADELGATRTPAEALVEWLHLQLVYTKQKYGLGAAVKTMLATDGHTLTWCRDRLRGALSRLLTAAQQAGAVRTDVDATDVLRLVHGIAVASESAPDQADRLLGLVLDGLRPPVPDGP